MHADFALADEALLARVHELYGVLDREDVPLLAHVDVVDHRGQRRRLARAGLPRDEDEAIVDLAQIHHGFGELELGGGTRLRGDGPEHRSHAVELAHDVDPEPGHVRYAVGEIRAVLGLEPLDRQFRHDLVQGRLDHVGGERFGGQRLELAVLAHARRVARDEVQVGAVLIQHLGQIAVDGRHVFPQGVVDAMGANCMSVTYRWKGRLSEAYM